MTDNKTFFGTLKSGLACILLTIIIVVIAVIASKFVDWTAFSKMLNIKIPDEAVRTGRTTIGFTLKNSELKDIEELSTAKMTFDMEIDYSNGKIPLLTRKSFTMAYTGFVKAGIEGGDINIEIKNHTVIITVPEVKLLTVHVDTNSIVFSNKWSALFNWHNEEDVTKAICYAEEHLANEAVEQGILEEAQRNVENALKERFKILLGCNHVVFQVDHKQVE